MQIEATQKIDDLVTPVELGKISLKTLIALIAGVYFLFNPFPEGPSLDVNANALTEKEVASNV